MGIFSENHTYQKIQLSLPDVAEPLWHQNQLFLYMSTYVPSSGWLPPVFVFKGISQTWIRWTAGFTSLQTLFFSTHLLAKICLCLGDAESFSDLERRNIYSLPSSIIILAALQHVLLWRPKTFSLLLKLMWNSLHVCFPLLLGRHVGYPDLKAEWKISNQGIYFFILFGKTVSGGWHLSAYPFFSVISSCELLFVLRLIFYFIFYILKTKFSLHYFFLFLFFFLLIFFVSDSPAWDIFIVYYLKGG